MPKKIVIINGAPGVGKDTFISKCREFIDIHCYAFKIYNISSIQPAVDLARRYHWNSRHDPASRNMLAELKSVLDKYFDASFQYIRSEINKIDPEEKSIIFVHIREPENIKRLTEYLRGEKVNTNPECYTLYISAKDHKIQSGVTNQSDLNTANYDYDTIIENPIDKESKEAGEVLLYAEAEKYMKDLINGSIPIKILPSQME